MMTTNITRPCSAFSAVLAKEKHQTLVIRIALIRELRIRQLTCSLREALIKEELLVKTIISEE